MSFRNLFFVALALGVAAPASAQYRITEGSRLRVEVERPPLASNPVEGTLAYSPRGFSLHATDPAADGGVVDVPLTGVRHIEVYMPRDRARSARRGATMMGFIGGSIGLIAGPLIGKSTNKAYGPLIASTTAIGLGGGAALGAAGGALFARDGWQRHTVPQEWR